jgi:hypothetical protein
VARVYDMSVSLVRWIRQAHSAVTVTTGSNWPSTTR